MISPAAVVMIFFLLIFLIRNILLALTFSFAVGKAGYSKYWAMLLIIPGLELILPWIFAFIKWPNEISHNKSLQSDAPKAVELKR